MPCQSTTDRRLACLEQTTGRSPGGDSRARRDAVRHRGGEPQFTLPRIFTSAGCAEVFLEAFEGPLDLLLYLIRRQNLDILDIPIADITRQYMEYIELMQDLRLGTWRPNTW